VSPGETLTSRIWTRSVASSTASARETSRSLEELVRGQSGVGQRAGVGDAAHHGGRQLGATADHLRAERGPTLVGLEHEGQAEPVDHRIEHRLGAERPEGGVRQRDPFGRVETGAGELGLGCGLVPRPTTRAPGYRRTASPAAPTSPARIRSRLSAVQRDRDGIGRVVPQAFDDTIDVPFTYVDADAAQGRREPSSRP
jgi:hypothetical protein